MFKQFQLKDWIITVLLVYLIISNAFRSNAPVQLIDTKPLIAKIDSYKASIDSLKRITAESVDRDLKLQFLLTESNKRLLTLQQQLPNEKATIAKLSDAEQINFFLDYIRKYSSAQSDSSSVRYSY